MDLSGCHSDSAWGPDGNVVGSYGHLGLLRSVVRSSWLDDWTCSVESVVEFVWESDVWPVDDCCAWTEVCRGHVVSKVRSLLLECCVSASADLLPEV